MNDSLTQLLIDTKDHFGNTFSVGQTIVKPARKGSRIWLTTYRIDELQVRVSWMGDSLVAKCYNEEDEKNVTIELNMLCVIV